MLIFIIEKCECGRVVFEEGGEGVDGLGAGGRGGVGGRGGEEGEESRNGGVRVCEVLSSY